MVQIQKFRGETEKTLSTLAHYIISDDPKPSDVEIAFLLKSKMIWMIIYFKTYRFFRNPGDRDLFSSF